MQTLTKTIIAFLICSIVAQMTVAASPKDSLRFDVILNRALVTDTAVTFAPAFEITSDRFIILSSADQLYLLGWGGLMHVGSKTTPRIESFAYTYDSLLMIIRNDQLCFMDSTGSVLPLYNLPHQSMGISSGKYAMYIYDQSPRYEKNALYILAPGGKYSKLLEMPYPISSVIEYQNALFFSSGNAIFRYSFASKELEAITALPDGNTILSLTVNTGNDRIYFATDQITYTITDNKPSVITDKMGGILKYLDGLIIFNIENQLLIRIMGLDEAIESSSQPGLSSESTEESRILTNKSIIELHNNGLSDGIIINLIERNETSFDLDVDSVIKLSENNISSEVIMAMRRAMKKQNPSIK